MTQDSFTSALRAALTLAGSFLIGHSLFGHALSNDFWQLISGAVMTIGSTIWGIRDKPATIEGIQSAVRQIILAAGGVLLAVGRIQQQQLDSIIAIALVIVPIIQSHTSRVKVKQLANGTLQPSNSGKVVKSTLKILLVFLLIGLTSTGQAQSFFKPIPKARTMFHAVYGDSVIASPAAQKMTAFRPVLNAATYSEPDHVAMAGFGLSYQWLKYDVTTQKWQTTLSVAGLFYGGASIASPNQGIYAAGISLGFFNGWLNIGGAYNFTTKKFGPTIGTNVQLNN